MAKNKVRLFFKLPNEEEHVFMNLWQMFPEKSVYFNTLLKKAEVKTVGNVNKEKGSFSSIPVPRGLKNPKVSVHTSGQVHAKTSDGIIVTSFNVYPIEKLEYPQEICTIFPVNPVKYPIRKNIRKLDMRIDLSWIEKGSFGVKIYVFKPLPKERRVSKVLVPVDLRFPKGTNGRMTYIERREFGFYIFVYQTPKLTSSKYDVFEHWFFSIPQDSREQVKPVMIEGRTYEKDGVKIEISEPKVELKKVE